MASSLHVPTAVRLAASALCLFLAAGTVQANEGAKDILPSLDVPYVPTPNTIVYRMLELADVKPDDYVIDLGSGDGRIVIAAARDWDVKKGYGVDLDPRRVNEATHNARTAGVSDQVSFDQGNIFDIDFSEADVLTLYLLPKINVELRPVILDTLRPGTRVVSHSFDMGDWQADEWIEVQKRYIYKWIVPAKVEGKWEVTRADGSSFTLELTQKFQFVQGQADFRSKTLPVSFAKLNGAELRFSVDDEHFTAHVDGDTMTAQPGNKVVEGWHAKRI